jgi:ribosomal protein L21
MKNTIIALDGRQFLLIESSFFKVAQINKQMKTFILLNKIILVKSKHSLYIGQPYIMSSYIQIIGKIIKTDFCSKLIIFKMRSKKKYRHHYGYKPKQLLVILDKIND